ncbi:MAG: DUF2341 domain-containing protein [Candidatus Pacebacteria bacterium]|jgi:hypothetical protein|nr:DUF2341 domain-containing protein [Candidatus Paceibacterota bacterium]
MNGLYKKIIMGIVGVSAVFIGSFLLDKRDFGATAPNGADKILADISSAAEGIAASPADESKAEGEAEIVKDPWLNGYPYRKPITITNSTSTLTNYQVQVDVDTSTLVSASKMQSDCDDLRFTTADGYTLMDYWIESGCNTAATTIWTEIPSIANGTSTIYMYYGNASSTAASNGDNTFLLFDDFAGTSLDANKWVTAGSTYTALTVGSGYLRITATTYNARLYRYIASVNTFAYPFTVRASTRAGSNDIHGGFYIGASQTTTYDAPNFTVIWNIGTSATYTNGFTINSTSVNTTYISAGTWTNYQGNLATGASVLTIGENSYNNTAAISNANHYVKLAVRKWDPGRDAQYDWDWIAVRKYAATEPTANAGAEVQLITQAGTGAADWAWKTPVAGDYVKNGTSTNWTWTAWQDNSAGLIVPYSTSTDWTWYPQ